EQLGEKQVVQDLYALTRAISHPADRVAWLSILRAPWAGLSLQDLLLLTEGKEKSLISEIIRDVSHLSPDGQARSARVREVLAAAWYAARRCRRRVARARRAGVRGGRHRARGRGDLPRRARAPRAGRRSRPRQARRAHRQALRVARRRGGRRRDRDHDHPQGER